MHAIAVELARLHARHEHVPVVVGAVGVRIQSMIRLGRASSARSKNSSSTRVGRAGEQAEVRAPAAESGAEGMAGTDGQRRVS